MFSIANKPALTFSLLLAGLAVFYSVNHSLIITKKQNRQEIATRNLARELANFDDLAGFYDQWKESFKSADKIVDIHSLYGQLGLSVLKLELRPENLKVKGSGDRFLRNGLDIGLTKICIGSVGSTGLVVKSRTFESLINGITNLEARADTIVGGMIVDGAKGYPQATLLDFCILVRDAI